MMNATNIHITLGITTCYVCKGDMGLLFLIETLLMQNIVSRFCYSIAFKEL